MRQIHAIRLSGVLLFAFALQGSSAIAATAERPSLEVTTVDSKPWSLAGQKGHWVVLNFWATWCSPCLAEMPELDRFDREHDELTLIGLDFEDIEADALREFLKTHPVSYPIAPIDIWNPPKDFEEPRGLPTTYLIDPDGRVAKQFIGPVTGKMLEQAIDGARSTGSSADDGAAQ